MSLAERRRTNLKRILNEDFGSKQARLATRINVNPTQLNRWLSNAVSNTGCISERSARLIEDKCNKPTGWLDLPEGSDALAIEEVATPCSGGIGNSSSNSSSRSGGGSLERLISAWMVATEDERAVVDAWAKSVVSNIKRYK